MATGRAPMVKMSRTMPPTPVAAPWNGSTAVGWLWLSILKIDRQAVAEVDGAGVLPPAPTSTRSPAGTAAKRRSRGLLFL